MSTDLIPLATASGIACLGQESEGWNLATGGGVREFSWPIPFELPFGTPPVVQVALSGFDLDQRDSARISVAPTNLTAEGFDLVVRTWEDSRVYGVEASWIAIGS